MERCKRSEREISGCRRAETTVAVTENFILPVFANWARKDVTGPYAPEVFAPFSGAADTRSLLFSFGWKKKNGPAVIQPASEVDSRVCTMFFLQRKNFSGPYFFFVSASWCVYSRLFGYCTLPKCRKHCNIFFFLSLKMIILLGYPPHYLFWRPTNLFSPLVACIRVILTNLRN